MVSILQAEEKVLRGTAKEVPLQDISTPKIKKVLADMKKALASQDDGVAIAAPQIGVPLRIFIISGRVLHILKEETVEVPQYPDMIFINPVITKLSKATKLMEEGCLSVRYLYGKVKRSTKAHIEAYDENGVFMKKGASGLMAQIFQHETDHLNGVLFTDKAQDLEEIPPERLKQNV
jgi:peptide deformylase